MMLTFETEFAQGAFAIVHAKTFVPNAKPVMDVVGESELVIVPLPEISVHVPIPTVAVLAVIKVFGLLLQSI